MVEFVLEEIFVWIFCSNFPGPVVEFFLEMILVIVYSNFPGPVVEFYLGEIFLRIFDANLAPKKLRNISPSDVVWTGCGGVVVWTGWTGGRVFS